MTAVQLFQTLTTGGCRLVLDGEQLRIQDPEHVLTDALRQAIREHKQALLAVLTEPMPAVDSVPLIEERWDLPSCRVCGGRVRWLNTGPPYLVERGAWFWHCLRCSPPPAAAEVHA